MNIIKKAKRVFNSTVFLQASLKAFELDDRIMNEKYGLQVKQLDYNNDSDLEIWMQIIHTSYDDCHFTLESARNYLINHPYLTNTISFVFTEKDIPVATISIGRYKENMLIGGAFRLGVIKSAQGHGYGRLSLLYAVSKLATFGLKYVESAVMFKRKESLYLHYALGFHPQYNIKYLADRSVHPWYRNLNFILNIRLKHSYESFLRNERKKYIAR